MIQEKLDEAGIKLDTGHRLVLFNAPFVEPGDLTADASAGARMFEGRGQVNLTFGIGPWHQEDAGLTPSAVKEAVNENVIQLSTLRLTAFRVNLAERTLKVGNIQPNRLMCVRCLHCGRTYHEEERTISWKKQKFFCRRCFDSAMKKHEQRKKPKRSKPQTREFRMDRPRNFVRYKQPKLSQRLTRELAVASAVHPNEGGELILPRPFIMFEPGASKVVWEPGDEDSVGQKLQERCQRVGQQPVPLKMVVDAYAPRGWSPLPWRWRDPFPVPGIIGAQLLLDGRAAGWVRNEELTRSCRQLGWLRDLPEYEVGSPDVRAREV
jgi:hypothetical protein